MLCTVTAARPPKKPFIGPPPPGAGHTEEQAGTRRDVTVGWFHCISSLGTLSPSSPSWLWQCSPVASASFSALGPSPRSSWRASTTTRRWLWRGESRRGWLWWGSRKGLWQPTQPHIPPRLEDQSSFWQNDPPINSCNPVEKRSNVVLLRSQEKHNLATRKNAA